MEEEEGGVSGGKGEETMVRGGVIRWCGWWLWKARAPTESLTI